MMKRNEKYDALSASSYYDLVLSGSSEAVYYLLKCRLGKALYAVHELHGFGLSDDFEDTLDDFFLYLYDSNQDSVGKPFTMVGKIYDKRTFFGWTIATYRHFLLNRAKEEIKRKELMKQVCLASKEEDCGLSNETMILFLASAIAYADQQFKSRNLFVFYRMLLSFLDHSKAIPQEAMARALDMQPVTYRVCSKRQKDRFLEFILCQEAGVKLELDVCHLKMRERIVDGFERLYELLMEYYEKALKTVPKASAVQWLRSQYGRREGMMHEERPPYGYLSHLDINVLYPKIKDYLEVSG